MLEQILDASKLVEVLDISEFHGSDFDILSILESQNNLVTLVAGNTRIGPACFGVLGKAHAFPGAKLKHLDLQGTYNCTTEYYIRVSVFCLEMSDLAKLNSYPCDSINPDLLNFFHRDNTVTFW